MIVFQRPLPLQSAKAFSKGKGGSSHTLPPFRTLHIHHHERHRSNCSRDGRARRSHKPPSHPPSKLQVTVRQWMVMTDVRIQLRASAPASASASASSLPLDLVSLQGSFPASCFISVPGKGETDHARFQIPDPSRIILRSSPCVGAELATLRSYITSIDDMPSTPSSGCLMHLAVRTFRDSGRDGPFVSLPVGPSLRPLVPGSRSYGAAPPEPRSAARPAFVAGKD